MALKEHPFLVTTSFKHDKTTISYDITKRGRSEALGRVYKLNAEGKAELPEDGEAFDGVITAVDATQITGAYMCGGLRVPLANGATVERGSRLVAGLGANGEKGFVKAAVAPTRPDDAADANAVRSHLQAVVDALQGKGYVQEFDTTHALLML